MDAKVLIFNCLFEFSRRFLTNCCAAVLFVAVPMLAYGQPDPTKHQSTNYAPPGVKMDQPLPDFSIRSVSGQPWTQKKLEGRVTLISFWYIGCAPCMAEFRYLNLFMDSIPHQDFQVLTFARNTLSDVLDFLSVESESYALVRQIHKVPEPKFEILPSCSYMGRKDDGCSYLNDSLGVMAYPTTLLIDKAGKVRFISVGFPRPELSASDKNPFAEPKMKDYFDKVRGQAEKLLLEQP